MKRAWKWRARDGSDMWPRVIEVMLACWLMVSPFVFRYPADARFLWLNDYACALLIILFSMLSNIPRIEKIHLLNLLVAGWLILIAYLQPSLPPAPPYQNYFAIALGLIIFGILPAHASEPPRKWKEFYGGEWGNL